MIRLDRSKETVVIVCTRCHYRDIDTDRAAAWARGLAHVRAIHPADTIAADTARRNIQRATRETTGNPGGPTNDPSDRTPE